MGEKTESERPAAAGDRPAKARHQARTAGAQHLRWGRTTPRRKIRWTVLMKETFLDHLAATCNVRLRRSPMDEEIERLVIGVRADTTGFARDVAAMKGSLGDQLGSGADVAGRAIETSLLRAVKSGKLGFDDLRKTALAAMGEIAAAAVKGGIQSILGGGTTGGGASGLLTVAAGLLTGLPGRATGGPVSPGRAYMVGERGPELFVPTSSGSIAPPSAAPARDVRVAISVAAGAGEASAALQRSSRQVARAVKAALMAG